MTVANNASNVISEVKRTPLAAMTHLLISTKGALRRPITYITAVKRHCTDGVTKCPAEFFSPSIMVKWMIDANNASNVISEEKRTPYAAMTHLLMANDLIIASNLLCQ